MTIYLDNDYKCHVMDDGTMTAVETKEEIVAAENENKEENRK